MHQHSQHHHKRLATITSVRIVIGHIYTQGTPWKRKSLGTYMLLLYRASHHIFNKLPNNHNKHYCPISIIWNHNKNYSFIMNDLIPWILNISGKKTVKTPDRNGLIRNFGIIYHNVSIWIKSAMCDNYRNIQYNLYIEAYRFH